MNNDILDEALSELINGSAICLLGAGFSMEATDASGQDVPGVRELNQEICKLAKLENEENASLTDLADYCEGDSKLFSDLQAHLMRRLTLCKPTEDQKTILEMPWRAVFTTNFDDVAEVCLKDRNVLPIEPPPLNWSAAMFRKRRTKNGKQATEAGRDSFEVTAS